MHGSLHPIREGKTAHINDEIELRAPSQLADALGEMIPQIEVLLVHGEDGVRRQVGGGTQPRAGGDQDIAAVGAREGLRHLAAAGVTDAHEEDSFQLAAHSFSRNSAWTRVSRVNSGWNVAARCAPFRSEEHTSELQSLRHLVCRLLLEK